jgi:type IV secretory pathway TrbF-like protein
MFVPRVPNPFDDDAQRTERLGQNLDDSRRWRLVFFGGWLVLGVFGLLVLLGYPGSGVVLVPIGVGMIIGGGIQLVLDRL